MRGCGTASAWGQSSLDSDPFAPSVIPSERSDPVIPSERSDPVIPSERSESRDLHLRH